MSILKKLIKFFKDYDIAGFVFKYSKAFATR